MKNKKILKKVYSTKNVFHFKGMACDIYMSLYLFTISKGKIVSDLLSFCRRNIAFVLPFFFPLSVPPFISVVDNATF